jgi:hypothetical protein
MITLSRYLDRGLRAFLRSFDLEAEKGDDDFTVRVATLRNSDEAQTALSEFCSERWPGTAEHSWQDRAAEAGELFAALVLLDEYEPDEVFPRCLSAANPRASEAGIDVTAFRVQDSGLAPLDPDERLTLAEAKHSVDTVPGTPLGALDGDVKKTNFERVANELQLLVSYLEDQEFGYPERVNKFLEGHSVLELAALVDSERIDPSDLAKKGREKFKDATTPTETPVGAFLAAGIPELEKWITEAI